MPSTSPTLTLKRKPPASRGNGIDILASAGSLTRVGVYLQPGHGIQVCHPTTVATCTGGRSCMCGRPLMAGPACCSTATKEVRRSRITMPGIPVHGGAFTGNAGDGMTLINTVHNTIVAPDISSNGVFGIHLASWALENTISVGRDCVAQFRAL